MALNAFKCNYLTPPLHFKGLTFMLEAIVCTGPDNQTQQPEGIHANVQITTYKNLNQQTLVHL